MKAPVDITLFERVQAPIGGEENLKKERKMGQGSYREKKEGGAEKKTKCYISWMTSRVPWQYKYILPAETVTHP